MKKILLISGSNRNGNTNQSMDDTGLKNKRKLNYVTISRNL